MALNESIAQIIAEPVSRQITDTPYAIGGGSSLMLDKVGGLNLGFSSRKLISSYKGSAFNIRRSSDNAQLDIGFVGRDFDTATFNAFVGGGSGFVTTWYDQVNGNHAIQATAANQPQLVMGATQSGKPALVTSSKIQFLVTTSAISFSIGLGISTVAKRTTTGGYDYIAGTADFDGGAAGFGFGFAGSTNGALWTINDLFLDSFSNCQATAAVPSSNADGLYHNLGAILNASTAQIYQDGVAATVRNSTPGTITPDTQKLYILSDGLVHADGFLGGMSEFIIGQSLTAAQIAAFETSQRIYFGTP